MTTNLNEVIENKTYQDKIFLAPMVRIGTLPMRLLSLNYGADMVYTEELIDWKLLRSERKENAVLGTIDYVDRSDGTIVFRTCNQEKDKVILQIGTCDPDRALQVARLVEDDVAGIDINMGCPKEFSIKGGMGVALLAKPEKAQQILKKLVTYIKKPITCKIRVFENEQDTLNLCKKFESCGIKAIGIHGRTKNERPRHLNRNQLLKKISQSLEIPVIANGGSKEINSYEDIELFRKATGCSSVMIARAAEWNASVFRKNGKLPLDDVIKVYLKLCVDYDNAPANTKYCVQNMLRDLQETPRGKQFLESQTLQQICDLWDLGSYCKLKQLELKNLGLSSRRDVCPLVYKKLIFDSDLILELPAAFLRSLYVKDADLPKTRLLAWSKSKGYKVPSYKTIQVDKLFQATVTVDGRKYRSNFWEKNKRWAEQGAAIVCLCAVGIISLEELKEKGII